MKSQKMLIGLLFCFILGGCGSGNEVITDPSKLKPLTDAEKAEIKKQDEAVNEEEGRSFDVMKKKK